MRTAYEEDEQELEAGDHTNGRELTLSSTTLLAIFFGLVLVCGLFFGFGYTLGRRAPSEAAIEPTSVQAATTTVSSQPKPSAASQSTATTKPLPDSAQDDTTDTTESDTPQSEPTTKIKPETVVQSEAVKPPPQVKPALTPASQPGSQSETQTAATIMVQIAAVSNAADAGALVNALHKHGYNAGVYHQTTDSLNHVQIGPFATRAEALAMRQKLQSDGYNAIMK